MMKRILWLGFTVLLGCSRSDAPAGTDSSTHWLDACRRDADCGDAWECICGVCAAQCETQSPCQDVASDRAGVCTTLNCERQPELGVCTVACSNEQPCPKSLDCQAGVCVPDGAQVTESPGSEADASAATDSASSEAPVPSSSNASIIDPSTDPTAPPTLDAFADAFLEATCQFMITCRSTDDDQQGQRLALGNVESCKQIVQWLPLQRDVRARIEATRDGLFSYDATLGGLALTRIQAGCDLMNDAFERLNFDDLGPEVFDGKVELAGACNEDVECRGDAHCAQANGDCVGSCRPRIGVGQECDGDTPCADTASPWPLACDFEAANPVCKPTVIISNLVEGEACTTASSLGNQIEFRLCGPNSFCSRDQGGICKPLLNAGEPCFDQYDVCEDGAVCTEEDPSDPETLYFCRTFSMEQTAGNPCDDRTTACNPFVGLACNEDTQQCEQRWDDSLGSACNGFVPCADDLYCDDSGEASQCDTRLPVGAECGSSDACESGHCVSDDSGLATCAQRYCSSEP